MSEPDGSEFDAIAAEYDRVRPSYPDALVDAACDRARLSPGSRVLEVGCGTGQLTEMLAARRLEVDAVDPGLAALVREFDRTVWQRVLPDGKRGRRRMRSMSGMRRKPGVTTSPRSGAG